MVVSKSYKLPEDLEKRLRLRTEEANKLHPLYNNVSEAQVVAYLLNLALDIEQAWKTTKATAEIQSVLDNLDEQKLVDAIFNIKDDFKVKQILAVCNDRLASRPVNGSLIKRVRS